MTNKFSEVRGAEPAAMPAGQARAQRVESRSGEAAEIRARLGRAEELLEEGKRLMASGRRSVWRYPESFESLRDYALERMRLIKAVRRLEKRVARLRLELAKAEGAPQGATSCERVGEAFEAEVLSSLAQGERAALCAVVLAEALQLHVELACERGRVLAERGEWWRRRLGIRKAQPPEQGVGP